MDFSPFLNSTNVGFLAPLAAAKASSTKGALGTAVRAASWGSAASITDRRCIANVGACIVRCYQRAPRDIRELVIQTNHACAPEMLACRLREADT